MSALCQKRPNAPQQKAPLFDRLVSGDEQLIGHGEAEHPGGLVAGPDVTMQESDGANAVCSFLRLPVPILPARRVAATPPPFGPACANGRDGPPRAVDGRPCRGNVRWSVAGMDMRISFSMSRRHAASSPSQSEIAMPAG